MPEPTEQQVLNELLSRREEMSPEQVEQLEAIIQNSPAYASEGVGIGEERSVGGFIGNIGSSGVRMASDIGTAAAHPIQTLQGIGSRPRR
jgi:hypothetical protein